MSDARRDETIDVMRAASIIVVVLFHYTSRIPEAVMGLQEVEITDFFSFGWIGVYCFFVISGYCIIGSAQRSSSGLGFFIKRISRIYPPFIIISTFVFICMQFLYVPSFDYGEWSFRDDPVGILDYVATTFFMARDLGFEWVDGAYWTLLVEMKYYFILSIFLILFQFRNALNYLVVFAYFVNFMWILSILYDSQIAELIFRNIFLAPYWAFFILGMHGKNIRDGDKRRMLIVHYIIFTALSIINLSLISMGKPNPTESVGLTMLFYILFLVWFNGYILAGLYGLRLPASGKLVGLFISALARLGKKSFIWYLIHQNLGIALLYVLFGLMNHWLAIILVIALGVVASEGLSWLVEHRFRELTQRRLTKLTAPIAGLLERRSAVR